MAKPQVTLTMAGDSSKLEKAFESVGASAKDMANDVGSASREVATETSAGFDRAGEAADNAEGKAQGFASTLTGTKDTATGLAEIMRGNTFEGFVMVGQGAADLAEGLNYTVIPAVKALATGFIGQAVQSVRATAATVAHTVAQKAAAVAAKATAAAQWLLNAAMTANPIGLVIAAIVALVAIFVVAYKKSETFRNIVKGSLLGVKIAAQAVGHFFTDVLWPWIKGVWNKIEAGARFMVAGVKAYFTAWKNSAIVVKNFLVEKFNAVVSFFRGLPGKIGRAARGMFDGIRNAFRSAVNWIIDRWNSLSFTLPSVNTGIPGVGRVGGFTLSTPNIPRFHSGGVMPGAPGTEGLALLQAGERVTPAGRSAGPIVLELRLSGQASGLERVFLSWLQGAVRSNPGVRLELAP